MLVNLEYVYYVAAVFLIVIAGLSLKDTSNPRRLLTAAFWALFAISFAFGKLIPPMYMGIIVIVMAVIAGFGGVRPGKHKQVADEERAASAAKYKNKLFLPILMIPLLTLIGATLLKDVTIGGLRLLDKSNVTLAALGVACVLAFVAAITLTKQKSIVPVKESRRLLDSIGWAAVLPQTLASLGALFSAAGVGKVIAELVGSSIPVDNRLLVVAAYSIGMAVFTMIMGNAFAAFPVMTAGIGLPLLVGMHGANPAVMSAIGMLSGYCGTLMTPMGANFNIVPAALLDLPKYSVIKAQVPTALILLAANIVLMYVLAF
ncbi:DUF979 domain-containing protein [Paenibacillus oleatilyticus]|uniref:DUF979 domain-containing protein n=1 Tax=Paenibacillus oleatilyticus TaxID=2594886 RepID=UPI001C1FF5B5|nr:DUF979 domain-containing protein [Paenibacillus oleatilyticus]MBU7316880.1 DUF979 domain-containing protein [Paenibacillus oleatilyticus]